MANEHLKLTVNGTAFETPVGSTETLLDLLRDHLGITSPKRGCETGDCGACTVLVDGNAVLACLYLATAAEGRTVVTVEGLGTIDFPHVLQQSFYEHHAAQCGFCTPGMIMAAKARLDRGSCTSLAEARNSIENICRCGTYHAIAQAVLAAARAYRREGDE